MEYDIEFKPRAIKDLRRLPKRTQSRVIANISELGNDLTGDVKRLTNYTPEFRLRVGQYRVLFEVEESTVIIYRIVHRKDAYT